MSNGQLAYIFITSRTDLHIKYIYDKFDAYDLYVLAWEEMLGSCIL